MAKRAVLEFEVHELFVESLVLTNLALVELLLTDRHARSNAGTEVRATLLAVDITITLVRLYFEHLQLVDDIVALGTVELLFLLVMRLMSKEEVDSQQFIRLTFLLGDRVESLQLNQGTATFSVALVEEAGNGHKGVDVLGLQLLLVLDESHSRLHGSVVVLLVELSLAQQVEVDRFGSLPRIGESLVS